VLSPADAEQCSANVLVASNPYATYARIAATLYHERRVPAGVHPSAVVEPGATIGEGCAVGAHAYLGPGVSLAARVTVGPGCVLDGTIRPASSRA
jgi:UDP-3-O-[3-hydroxymyristoyl] glucosamine N-acyltransferase